MKISKIVHKNFSEVAKMPRFNMNTLVKKQRRILQPLMWLVGFPETIKRRVKINKVGMEKINNEAYLLLCNHNSFYDFKVATRAVFPRQATYIVAVDGFINREGIMREVGCFGKRKFINDLGLIKQVKRSVTTLNHICMIYPEARYSQVGTSAVLPESLGKLIKLLKVPVVSLICHGNHLAQPNWNLRTRKVKTTADMTLLYTAEDIKNASVSEINQKIKEAFVYDDYAWQKENNIKIKEKFRAEGLEHVLYKCPACLKEGTMETVGKLLSCNACLKMYAMGEDGSLSALHGETEFSHIPAWYEWQRSKVREEIINGTYYFEHEVEIDSLPNSKGFYRIGSGVFIHDKHGFTVRGKSQNGETFVFRKEVEENYSVHVEYNYFGKGDAISFSFPQDTYYMLSTKKSYLVTKVALATEELYKLNQEANALNKEAK